MAWLFPSVIATLTGSLILFAVYYYLHRTEKDKSLGILSLAWALYATRFVCMLFLITGGPQPLLLVGHQLFSLASAWCMLWGMFLFTGQKMARGWSLATALCAVWAGFSITAGLGFMAVSLPSFLFLGLLYIRTGALLLRSRHLAGSGRLVAGWAFILWGLHKADYPFIRPIVWLAPWGYLLGAVLELCVAIAIILVYFHKAKDDVAASEARLRGILENLDAVAIIMNPEGRLTFVNDHLLNLSGRSMQEAMGQDWFQVFLPDKDRDFLRRMFVETIITGRFPAHHENEIVARDGRRILIAWNNTALKDSRGKVRAVASIGHDITESRKAEEELKASEARYRSLIENSSDVVSRCDREHRFLFVSPNIADYQNIPITPEDFIGKTPEELGLREEVTRQWETQMEKVFQTGRIHDEEVRFSHQGGDFVLNWRLVPELDQDGRVASVLSITRDVTRQRADEQNFRLIFNQMHEGFVLGRLSPLGDDFTFLAVNPAFERILGLSTGDLAGRDAKQALPRLAATWLAPAALVAREESSVRFCQMLFEQSLFLEVLLFYTMPGQFAALVRDSSQQVLAEREKSLLEKQLVQSQKMEALGTLAGGIAHDFNNVLAAIMGYTELTLFDLPPDDPGRDNLEQTMRAGQRGKELVRQILSFARPSSQESKPLDLASLLADSVKMLKATLPATVTIRQSALGQPGPVLSDPTQMHQVIMNLCANAADAMAETGGELALTLKSVDLSARQPAASLALSPGRYNLLIVSDQGPGIPPECLERVFEPFFTTKPAGRGTGMGLSVAHGIVTGQGGAITARNRPGGGASFMVYLPEIAQAPAEPERSGETGLPRGTERVLLVDDETMLVKVNQAQLARLGYRAEGCDDPHRALALLERDPTAFDLVISDQTMPGLTGLELAHRLAALRPDLPVIICSGYSQQLENGDFPANVKRLLPKPLVRRELAEAVRGVLDDQGRA